MKLNAWSRKTKVLVALGISVLLLATVAFAGTSATPGYDAFKEMLRTADRDEARVKHFESGSFSFNVDIVDNKQAIIALQGTGQASKEDKEMSAEIILKASSLEKKLKVYGNSEQFIVLDVADQAAYVGKPSDTPHGQADKEAWAEEHGRFSHHQRDFDSKSEAVLDFFVGDMKKDFEVITAADGSSDIVLDLEASEIPAIVNLMASMGNDSHHGDSPYHREDHSAAYLKGLPLFDALKALETELPMLEKDIAVHALRLVFDRNTENELIVLSTALQVSGVDAAGKFHNLSIEATFKRVPGQGAEILPISLDGKRVYEIKEN